MAICTAHRTNGERCKAPAIAGGRVCRAHGGGCPQVLAKARLRLATIADPVLARLATIALSKKTKNSDAITAAKDILDRAGLRPEREAAAAGPNDGTVLWEEFVSIHKRVTAGKKDADETTHAR